MGSAAGGDAARPGTAGAVGQSRAALQVGRRCALRRAAWQGGNFCHGHLLAPAYVPDAAVRKNTSSTARARFLITTTRFVGDGSLWAVLAALAMAAGELPAAEAAFAAIGATDRLQFVQRCGRLPSAAVRAAEVALYRRQPAEAEALLLQVRACACVCT